ncbi:MAG TPA: NAD(P)-dependent alcohol dehydrogenase [Alphaproteobacteria bacterium]|nr:NAD(P)-dependent alcohol dehydrogenase [Alphaproteobacteria bacterium]
MKVMQIQDDWSAENIKLAERPDPEPGPGEVVVAMQAGSLNYRDFVMTRRGYGRRSGELPLVPCSDGAGTVAAVGAGVSRVTVGDLVCPIFSQTWFDGPFSEASWPGTLGGPRDGTFQEAMLFSEEGVVKAPKHMSAAEAASIPCAAVTAWNALVHQGKIQAGDLVLVQGTGGVSMFALQIAKMMGAEVIATSSSDEKLKRAKTLGADHLINYNDDPDWHKTARGISGGGGVDHIVEVGGAGTLERSIRAVRPSGTISLIGVLAGAAGELNLGPVVTQNIALQGITVGSRAIFEDMIRAMELHQTRPALEEKRFAFEDLGAAIAALPQGKHFGKVVCEF